MSDMIAKLARFNKDYPDKNFWVQNSDTNTVQLIIADIGSMIILEELASKITVLITMKNNEIYVTQLSLFWVSTYT